MATDKNITNYDPDIVITGSAYADTIANIGSNVTINALDGNDSICNSVNEGDSEQTGSNVLIDGGAGDDIIQNGDANSNGGVNVTILGGEGADTITNNAQNALLVGGAGSDSIKNSGANSIIEGGEGNDTIQNSGDCSTLAGGEGNDILISSGNKATLSGGSGDNTLTGGQGENIFIHSNGAKDIITNYVAGRDIIILESGKVSETLTSGNDVILKITSNTGSDLGTITVQNGNGKSLAICDEEYNNRQKEIFQKFSDAYIRATIKAFEEDEDVKSILTDGENSVALAEIKAVDPALAKNIADALKAAYNASNEYLSIFVEESPQAASNTEVFSGNVIPEAKNKAEAALNNFNNAISALDFGGTVLQETSKLGVMGNVAGKAISKVTTPLSVVMSATACAAYSSQLYNQNIVPASQQSLGSGVNGWQKTAHLRSQNPEVYDNWAKSTMGFATTVAGVAVGVALAGAGAPAIIAAGAFALAPFALEWAYDNFVAPQS